MTKIYDCTIFFDETMMYEVRLNILNNYVDKFVIVEATTDHSGKKKILISTLKNLHNLKKKLDTLS